MFHIDNYGSIIPIDIYDRCFFKRRYPTFKIKIYVSLTDFGENRNMWKKFVINAKYGIPRKFSGRDLLCSIQTDRRDERNNSFRSCFVNNVLL
jgi:hypothetical protein